MHKCGKCEGEYSDEAGYLAHTCEVTGFTPAMVEHQGPEFAAISDAALARGEARKGEVEHPSTVLGKKLGAAVPPKVVKK